MKIWIGTKIGNVIKTKYHGPIDTLIDAVFDVIGNY